MLALTPQREATHYPHSWWSYNFDYTSTEREDISSPLLKQQDTIQETIALLFSTEQNQNMLRVGTRLVGANALRQFTLASSSMFTKDTVVHRKFATQSQQPTSWNTKIVCTIGPSSSSDEVLEKMILAGKSAFVLFI